MSIKLAGTGCGSLGSMTTEVKAAIEQADILIGAKRLLESIPEEMTAATSARRIPAIYAEEILGIIKEELQADGNGCDGPVRNICVLYSGDSGFYSGTRSLVPLLERAGIEADVLPGISSIQMLSARLKRPWQDWRLVSAHGTDCNAIAEVSKGKPTFFLTGGKLGPADLCGQLLKAGLGDLSVTVGERLSYDDETIVSGTAAELADADFAPLSVMLAEPAPSLGDLTPGIPDDAFLRGNVPMTKREVRASILSHMEIKRDDILWDVGSGTGSVTIEMAMKAPEGMVYAIERNGEGVELLEANLQKFGTWNIVSACGSAPEGLLEFPAPDKVFIGGSSGNLKEIIDVVLDKNPAARICITAIVLETLSEAVAHMSACGLDTEIVQIAVSKSKPAGTRHMMLAENPIFIITGQRRETGEHND